MAVGLFPHGDGGGSDDEQCVVCACIVTHACDDSNEDECFSTLKLIMSISTPLVALLLDRPTYYYNCHHHCFRHSSCCNC